MDLFFQRKFLSYHIVKIVIRFKMKVKKANLNKLREVFKFSSRFKANSQSFYFEIYYTVEVNSFIENKVLSIQIYVTNFSSKENQPFLSQNLQMAT